MLPGIFFLSLLFSFPDCLRISRGYWFFRRRVNISISSAHKHLHLTKTKKLTMATNLQLVIDHDHSYHQKSWGTEGEWYLAFPENQVLHTLIFILYLSSTAYGRWGVFVLFCFLLKCLPLQKEYGWKKRYILAFWFRKKIKKSTVEMMNKNQCKPPELAGSSDEDPRCSYFSNNDKWQTGGSKSYLDKIK